jgi:hypothetical protein
MAGEARRTRRPAPAVWGIRSVSVRARDGPQRLDQIYRLLVVEPAASAAAQHRPPGPATVLEEQEGAHARRRLRPRVD